MMERELILLELKSIRRSRVEMDVVPAVLFESFFIFLNFYSELWSQSVLRYRISSAITSILVTDVGDSFEILETASRCC